MVNIENDVERAEYHVQTQWSMVLPSLRIGKESSILAVRFPEQDTTIIKFPSPHI